MRKSPLIIGLLLAAAIGGGGWWLLRRPTGRPPDEQGSAAFSTRDGREGWLIQHLDEQVPLRAFRWLPLRGDGLLVAQLITQNDEQQVHLFKQGRLRGSWKLERPGTATAGFFRFAELKEALLADDSTLLLLYAAGSGSAPEESLLLALDLGRGSVRWSLRLEGSRCIRGGEPKNPGVFVWGAPKTIQWVPLNVAAGKTPTVKPLDLPAPIQSPADLLPMGADRFLLAHGLGLSSFAGPKGWVHLPLPARPAFPACPGVPGRLVRGSGSLWWQPYPGTLFEVGAEGPSVREVPLNAGAGDGPSRDLRLLRLLGADGKGGLWFGLASPNLEVPAPTPAPATAALDQPGQPDAPQPGAPQPGAPGPGAPGPGTEAPAGPVPVLPPAPSPEEIEAWRRHLAGGLGRVYRRPVDGGSLRLYDWGRRWRSGPEPPGFPPPQGDAGLRPEAGFLVLGAERSICWLPLQALGDGEAPSAN